MTNSVTEKKAQHTPGPWVAGTGRIVDLNDAECLGVGLAGDPWKPIAILSLAKGANETDAANARLIAAAPELLEALKHWVMAIDLVATDSYCEVCRVHAPKDEHGNVTGPIQHYGCPFAQARAAIAKAEGGAR